MDTQKPIQQPPEVWVKRLLSGLWTAAKIFDLQPPTINATSQKILKRSASFYEELVLAHAKSDYGSAIDSLARQLKHLTVETLPAGLEVSPPSVGVVDSYDSPENWQKYRQELLLWLGNAHVLFSFQQFAFLYDGFYGVPNGRRFRFEHLIPNRLSEQHSPAIDDLLDILKLKGSAEVVDLTDFAFRITLNQIASDLLTLSRGALNHSTSENLVIATRVYEADRLALHVRQSMRKYLPQPTAVLTYVDRMAKIRLVPYAPIALISIPASSLAMGRDLLAIPHEFGHYLYRNGITGQTPLSAFPAWLAATIQQQTDRLSITHWLEEIFADVVGCLVGGPATALSFQDMTLEKVGGLFLEDSGKHPIPAIRPFIHLRVLGLMELPILAAGLRTRWEEILKRRLGDGWHEKPLSVDRRTPETIGSVRNLLEDAAEKIFIFFAANETAYAEITAYSRSLETESTPNAANDPAWLETIYDTFEKSLPQGSLTSVDAAVIDSEAGWAELVVTRGYLDPMQINGADGRDTPVTPEKWLEALFFDGWNTEGPGGGVPHLGG